MQNYKSINLNVSSFDDGQCLAVTYSGTLQLLIVCKWKNKER